MPEPIYLKKWTWLLEQTGLDGLTQPPEREPEPKSLDGST